MRPFSQLLLSFSRLSLALCAAFCALALDMSAAIAQNQNCAQLVSMIRSIERNPAFDSYNSVVTDLRARENQLRQAESAWVQSGCQQALNSGAVLNLQCQQIAQAVTLNRNNVQGLTGLAREGQQLAQNREQLLQQFARFNCNANQSGITFNQARGPQAPLLDQIFGGGGMDGYDYVDGPYNPWATVSTRRTVCVRTCDGYYWPISFSTTDDYIAQDAIRCHEMCPGTEVLLFSYQNPGEEPEDMISISGVPYRSMPYAFAYRTDFNAECSCQTQQQRGSITTVSSAGGQSQAVIDFGAISFPLPRPDPRAPEDFTVADAIYIPLPRPRPRDDGTSVPAIAAPSADSGLRIVNFGDREVRVVGPQTPFAPEGGGES